MDPHYPYDAAGSEGNEWERYLAEVSLCDAAIGGLWDLVAERGLEDRTVVIVTADHGEGFGEHNTRYHQSTVYEELVHVPLIIVAAGASRRVVDDPVSLLDLGPTVIDLFGATTPGHHMGQSLVPYLQGRSPDLTRPIGGLTTLGKSNVYYLVADDETKVIVNEKFDTREIYDLEEDPEETDNLYDELSDEGEADVRALLAFYERHVADIETRTPSQASPKKPNAPRGAPL